MFKQWRRHSADVRSKLGVSSEYSGWTSQAVISLPGVPKTPRVLDLLNTAWAERLQACGGAGNVSTVEARIGFWANVSQAVQRHPYGTPGTLATSGAWYSFQHDFLLDGQDECQLQGMPRAPTPCLSSNQLHGLAGEAFSVPCVSTFLYSMYLNPWGTWWRHDVASGN